MSQSDTNHIKISDHFSLHEFESPDTGEVIVHPQLLILLERVRCAFDLPVCITSGYRTPEHNIEVGGSPGSYHLRGMAADFYIPGVKVLDILHVCNAVGFSYSYAQPAKGFVHADIREYYSITEK